MIVTEPAPPLHEYIGISRERFIIRVPLAERAAVYRSFATGSDFEWLGWLLVAERVKEERSFLLVQAFLA